MTDRMYPGLLDGTAPGRSNQAFVYASPVHRRRAAELRRQILRNAPELSPLQAKFMAFVGTDPRQTAEQIAVAITVASLSGPEMDRPISEPDLIAASKSTVEGAARFLLEHAQPQGRA